MKFVTLNQMIIMLNKAIKVGSVIQKMNIEIANKLIEFRKKNGMSQENVAEKLGISRQAISRWERAESAPDINNLAELSKLYGISVDDLLNTNMVSEKSKLKNENNKIINENTNKNDYTEMENNESKCENADIVLAQIPFPFVIPAFIIWGLFGFHEGYNWFGRSTLLPDPTLFLVWKTSTKYDAAFSISNLHCKYLSVNKYPYRKLVHYMAYTYDNSNLLHNSGTN